MIKILKKIKKLRKRLYFVLGKPRIYYSENKSLKNYNLPVKNLNFYKKNSLTNLDLIEFIKNRIKF